MFSDREESQENLGNTLLSWGQLWEPLSKTKNSRKKLLLCILFKNGNFETLKLRSIEPFQVLYCQGPVFERKAVPRDP